MGRKQQQSRTSGNTKRASSERTATLLSANGAIPQLSAFFPSLATVPTNENDVEITVDSDFRLLLKKFYKRDATTKLKALNEFTALVNNKSEENLLGLLPFWPRHFSRLAMDFDRRVRENTFIAHTQLCLKLGKQIAPFLRSILPTWIVGRFDTYGPSASEAERGFNEVFTVQKRRKVIAMYLEDIVEQFRRNMFSLSVDTVPDSQDLTEEEREIKLLAIQSGTLQALRFIIETLMNSDEIDEVGTAQCVNLVNDPKIWHLAQHKQAAIQRVFYDMLNAALKLNIVQDLKNVASVTLMRLAGNKDPSICSAIWQAVIQFLSTTPDCWNYVDMKKQVLPQLKLVTKERGFGSGQSVFSAMLPFFSMMPDNAEYRAEVLQCLQRCVTENVTPATSVSELAVAARTFFECFRYSVVHFTVSSAEIHGQCQDYLLSLLRSVLTTKDPVITRVRNVVFKETHSLLCYLRQKSDSCEKYSIFGDIYNEIYTIMMTELDSANYQACASLHCQLNSSPESGKTTTKKTLSFACGSDAKPKSKSQSTSIENQHHLFELNLKLLSRVLTLCNSKPKSDLFKFLGDFFPLYYNDKSVEFFRKDGFDEERILESVKLWLVHEHSANASIKTLLTLASLKPNLTDGVMNIVQLCEATPQLLLTILDQASECFSCEVFKPVLLELCHTKRFTELIAAQLEGSCKWDIMTNCLCSASLYSDALIDQLMSLLIDDIQLTRTQLLERRQCSESCVQLCKTISRIFPLESNAWFRPLFPTLVFGIYQLSAQATVDFEDSSHEFKELGNSLRKNWLSALECDNDHSETCRLKILDDLKHKLTDPQSHDMDFVVECVLSLVPDDEAAGLAALQRVIPTSEQFEEICSGIMSCLTNRLVRNRDYALLILDTVGELADQQDYERLVITYEALLRIVEAKDAIQLLDVTHLILVNLMKPQSTFKSVISKLLEGEQVLENTVKLLCKRSGILWTTVLDSILTSTKYEVSKQIWQADGDCTTLAQQICVKHCTDTDELSNCLSSLLDKLNTCPESINCEQICLAISCINNGSDANTSSSLEQLIKLLDNLHNSHPERFEAFRVNSLHLAACFTCLQIVEKYSSEDAAALLSELCRSALTLMMKMIKNFSWHDVDCKSKITLATVVVLCDVVIKLHEQMSTKKFEPDDGSLKIAFYEALTEALVPELPAGSEKLWQMPDPALELVAQVYAALDFKVVNKFWRSQKRPVVATVESIMTTLCEKMQSKRLAVQMTAYALATSAVRRIIQKRDSRQSKELDIRHPVSIDPVLYGFVEDISSGLFILKSMYGGLYAWKRYSQEHLCLTSTYILAMSTILDFCSYSNPEERAAYFAFVEEGGHWTKYLDLLFEFDLDEAPPVAPGSHHLPKRFDFTHIVFWAIFQISERASGVLKSWYTKLNDNKLENRVRSLMTRHVSPILIAKELSHANEGLPQSPEWLLISISSSREIIARHMLEDIGKTLEISVQMEPCYPLKPLRISYDPDKVVGSKAVFQQWVHQLNIYLLSSEGSVVDALNAWKENFQRKLEGATECSVCYGVLHASTLRLPDYPCKTCKHRFHKACMYKWFRQGHSTCPLCRSVLG